MDFTTFTFFVTNMALLAAGLFLWLERDNVNPKWKTALSVSDKFFEHMEKKFLDFLNSNNKDKIREKTNPSRQLKSFPIKYTVEIISHNLPDHYYIVISGADKPGILIKLTKVLSNKLISSISSFALRK